MSRNVGVESKFGKKNENKAKCVNFECPSKGHENVTERRSSLALKPHSTSREGMGNPSKDEEDSSVKNKECATSDGKVEAECQDGTGKPMKHRKCKLVSDLKSMSLKDGKEEAFKDDWHGTSKDVEEELFDYEDEGHAKGGGCCSWKEKKLRAPWEKKPCKLRSVQASRRRCASSFDFKVYMDKHVKAKLNGGRIVEGTLRGFDPFLNLVLDDSTEVRKTGEKVRIGCVVMRGSSIVMLEALDRIS